ncbi:Cupin 1 [Fusarium oxysporum f. sp. vasinfectum]|nr:Cupin 1 [Fusarium oxysporum f. sp. vasinfectum]KAK2925406.1 Cupin 1 [Fusarium oxysporum f. sp. vasinfectum]
MSFPNVDMNLRWQDQNVVKKDGQWTVDGRPTPGVAVSHVHQPPNLPDKTWLGLMVTAPVNSATPPHTHAGAAIVATVIKGHVLNQMVHTHTDPKTGETTEHDSGPRIYGPGESWYEAPGCHHVRSENVGDEEAQFIANMILSNDVFEGLDIKARSTEDDFAKIIRVVVIDKEVEEQKAGKAATA